MMVMMVPPVAVPFSAISVAVVGPVVHGRGLLVHDRGRWCVVDRGRRLINWTRDAKKYANVGTRERTGRRAYGSNPERST